jgi:ornithine--oxo-acid transaminase
MSTLVANDKRYASSVNPQWVRLLDILQMNVEFTECKGAELFRTDGSRVLDFLSGYCVHNTGHNHPHIISALKEELDRRGPVMLQSNVPELAGELAERLCGRAGGCLKKAHFTSSGSEGVEAAIKFARAHTRRKGLVYADGAFHGLTCGALSLMGSDFWREGFGPLLPDARQVHFGDLKELKAELSTKECAAFIVETIQGEGGIRIPDAHYLQQAQALCRQYGSLFILDEVQTGMYRTGQFLAAQHFGLDPDIVILAKALSGGLIPVGAVLMTDAIYGSVYGSLHRAIIHTSTFSENNLAMRAGLATLDVLESEGLGERATALGRFLQNRLQETLAKYEMVRDVRGIGLFCGIEFQSPRQWTLRASFEAFKRIHPGMFGQMLVMNLFRDKGILTQMCGNNFQVLKVAPPLVVTEAEVDEFVVKMGEVVESIHSSTTFWTEALGLARRVVNI